MQVPMAALPSSQAIVVLSGMLVQPSGDAPLGEWSEAVDRFEAGMALFQAGKAPVLVCTGAWVPSVMLGESSSRGSTRSAGGH